MGGGGGVNVVYNYADDDEIKCQVDLGLAAPDGLHLRHRVTPPRELSLPQSQMKIAAFGFQLLPGGSVFSLL